MTARFKSELHNIQTEKINKIALRINDHKTIQASDGVTAYHYGNEFYAKLCNTKKKLKK